MTRLSSALAKGRNTNNFKRFNNYLEVFPYKVLTPPVLKNSVSSKKDKNKVVPCLEELGVLLNCWKAADFNQNSCFKEIKDFNKCYAESLKMDKNAGKPANRLSSDDVNHLLKRFPQPKMTYK